MKMQSSPKAGSASDKFCQLAPLDNTISLLGWLQVTVLNISFGIYSHGWGCCLMKWLPKKSARRCVGIVWLVCRPLVSSPGGSSTQQSPPALLSYYLREAPICRWNTDILQDGNSETRPRLFSAFPSSMWLRSASWTDVQWVATVVELVHGLDLVFTPFLELQLCRCQVTMGLTRLYLLSRIIWF